MLNHTEASLGITELRKREAMATGHTSCSIWLKPNGVGRAVGMASSLAFRYLKWDRSALSPRDCQTSGCWSETILFLNLISRGTVTSQPDRGQLAAWMDCFQ